MIRTRTLTRTIAALPLGAFALAVLPTPYADAAVAYQADWGISASCEGGFHWVLSVTNEGASDLSVKFATDSGESTTASVPAGMSHQMNVYDAEGLASTVRLTLNSVEADSESTPKVDCLPDGDSYATIEIVCPEPGSDEDIFVKYTMGIDGAAAHFEWSAPDGSTAGQTISNWEDHVTYKVAQGQSVDVSVSDTGAAKVLATLVDTVDCPSEEVVEEETPSSEDQGSSGQLPETGSGTMLAWVAAALTVAGVGALRTSRRRVTVAE